MERRSASPGPTETLLALKQADAIATRRLQLVGGAAAALLLGFVLLAAAGLRRDAGREWARLERHGARLGQLWTFAWVEAGWITLAGALFGAGLAAVGVAVAARLAGVDAGAVLRETIASPLGIAAIVVAWLAGAAVLVAAERGAGADLRLGPVHGLDLVALAIVGAVALAAARGSANSTSLSAGSDPLLALLPGLVAIAAAIVTARLVGPLVRLAGRGLRRGRPACGLRWSRLDARADGHPGGGLPGGRDRPWRLRGLLPAHAVAGRARPGGLPGAARFHAVRAGLGQPLEAAPMTAYSGLAPGGSPLRCFRSASTPRAPASRRRPTVLGVCRAAASADPPWRGELRLGRRSPTWRRAGAPLPAAMQGPLLPAGATRRSASRRPTARPPGSARGRGRRAIGQRSSSRWATPSAEAGDAAREAARR